VPGPASRIRSPPLPASDEPEDNVSAPPFPEPDVFDPADIATLLPLRLAKLPPVSAIAPVLLIDKNVVVAVPVEDAIKRSDEAVSPGLAKIANLESVLVAPIAKLPPTERLPVVVAPPAIVRPPVWVPLPMVDDAREYKPAVKPMRVLVAFAAVAPNVVVVKGNPNDDPLEVFMHTPPIEKHPCAKSIPRAKVDVAAVPVTLRYAVESPAVRVEVAGPVTYKEDVVAYEAKRLVLDAVVENSEVVVALVAVAVLIVNPPVNVDEALTITPIVVVGASTPFTTFQSLKAEEM
jgi:hypothetical protein